MTTRGSDSPTDSPTRRSQLRALGSILDGPLVVLLAGVVFLLVMHYVVAVNRVMPVTRARLVEMHEFLVSQGGEARGEGSTRTASGSKGDVYFLGSSVLLEGVDCGIVDKGLPEGTESFNLALMGAGAPQWMLLAPALREVKPRLVVMTVDLTGVTGLQTIPEEGMAIAEYWDFLPPDARDYFHDFLTDEQLTALNRPDWESLLAFRVFPIGAFDMYMREVSREGLRYEGYTTNVKDPWVRKERIAERSIDRWIENKISKVEEQDDAAMAEQLALIEHLVAWFAAEGIPSALVVAPVNPKLTAALGDEQANAILDSLRAVSERSGAPLINHKTLLGDDDFADHVHPYAPGRVIWSEKLGEDLGALLDTSGLQLPNRVILNPPQGDEGSSQHSQRPQSGATRRDAPVQELAGRSVTALRFVQDDVRVELEGGDTLKTVLPTQQAGLSGGQR